MIRNRGVMRFIIALAAAASVAAAASAGEPKSFLQVTEAARDAGFMGVVAIGDRNGPVISAAIGAASFAPPRKHRVDSVWPWTSATREVTAALVMQEVDRGRLSLDQTLESALPGFPGAGGRATIRQLLQHTSGLPNPERGAAALGYDAPALYFRKRAPESSAEDAFDACAGAPAAAPGARFDDNNCDYVVLGAVLEALNAKTWSEIVRERIVEPLALSTVTVAPRKRTKKRDVVGYVGPEVAAPLNEAAYGAGGALFGSAEDLLAFDRALLDGRLISDKARAEMWKGDPAFGAAALGAEVSSAALDGCASLVTLVERRGAIGGVQVRNIIAPDKGRMLVLFSNDGAFDFGEIRRGEGWSHAFASAAFCRKAE